MSTPAGVPGDYNGNGKVDGADYVVWRNGGPLQNEVATIGSITAEDYTEWRSRFGNMAGAGLGADSVPEPSALALVILALVAIWGRRGETLPASRCLCAEDKSCRRTAI
jgi:hypothetical protein